MKLIKTIISLSLVICMRIPVLAASETEFCDIDGHWARESIENMSDQGFFVGTSSNTFSPDEPLSRAMFLTVIGRYYESIFGSLEEKGDDFQDTQPGQWYSKYVCWATENMIIKGYGNDLFGPNDAVTREQAAAVIFSFTEYLNFQLPETDKSLLCQFNDAGDISKWADNAVAWAVSEKIMNGVDGNRIAPIQYVTRAQAATLLERFMTQYKILASHRTFIAPNSDSLFYDLADCGGWQIVIENRGDTEIAYIPEIDGYPLVFSNHVKPQDAIVTASGVRSGQEQLTLSFSRSGVNININVIEMFSNKPFKATIDSLPTPGEPGDEKVFFPIGW